MCIAGRTSSRTGDADPATPTRGGADPATSTNSSRRQCQTAQDAQKHALYNVPHVPWHQGNREVPGCGPTCGMQGTSVPLRASAVPLIAEFAPWGQGVITNVGKAKCHSGRTLKRHLQHLVLDC